MSYLVAGTRAKRVIASVCLAFTVMAGLGIAHATQADGVERNYIRYATLAKCQAGSPHFNTYPFRIVRDCTYEGRYLFGRKIDNGPYSIAYEVRR